MEYKGITAVVEDTDATTEKTVNEPIAARKFNQTVIRKLGTLMSVIILCLVPHARILLHKLLLTPY